MELPPGIRSVTALPQSSSSAVHPSTPHNVTQSPQDMSVAVDLPLEGTKEFSLTQGLPVFFPLRAERSIAIASGPLSFMSEMETQLATKEQQATIVPEPREGEQHTSEEFRSHFGPERVSGIDYIKHRQESLENPQVLTTSEKRSINLAPVMKNASHVHNAWNPIYIHTAKCDSCNKRNPSILQRCRECNMQWCEYCLFNFNDGVHSTEGAAVNWTSISRQKEKAVPTRKSSRICVKSADLNTPEQHTSKAGASSGSLQDDLDNLHDFMDFKRQKRLRNHEGLDKGGATNDRRLQGTLKSEKEAIIHGPEESRTLVHDQDESVLVPDALSPTVQASGTPLGATLDDIIEVLMKNNQEKEKIAKESALEREVQDTWTKNPHILELRQHGKEAEAREILEAARSQLMVKRGL